MHTTPARFAILVFTSLVAIWTALLALPIASATGTVTPLADALFTAVSAICVTGLATVDMASQWSLFGEIVILLGIQIGGVGVLTIASLLGLTVTRRLGLRQRLLVASDTNPNRTTRGASESQAVGLGDIGGLLGAVAISLLVIEAALTLLITPRLIADGMQFWPALWNGFYLAASAFTNTGFVPLADGLEPYLGDYYLLSVLAIGVFLGSIGFPVIFALYRYVIKGSEKRRHIGLHAKLTLATTLIFVILGWLLITSLEWNNPSTLGAEPVGRTLFDAWYMSIMTRSGGLGIIDPMEMNGSTRLVLDMLMFVGGGSASTAGGIKVTTIAVLFLAAYAEARGYKDMQAFGRRIPTEVLRVAVSVLIWGATIVLISTTAIMHIAGTTLDETLFEVISAFGTCGLSTGLSEALPDSGKYILAATMWAGRVGTVTLAAAVAATSKSQLFRFPEERPIVG
ncbi:TrkH family potassium uptake protein [Leucobacter sp. G161]|uniref:TrkH family potassium uptake protein n=1 Tax=Leucobacter sp. G161 TaxID=663704 RepID=UPI00073B2E73|nr:potassium transporter TrkG [Leucobacter sp. G161]KUF08610.1 potassium transporter Trk [Leucobacter sp. G161]